VRVDKIYTLSQSIVVKTFGRVDEKTLERIRKELQALVAKK
jgi:mRNA-degrading endonuclease toxin of MazEF toxin-antitoxin module